MKENELYTAIVNEGEEYLEHHGILGMKWGKRNGPPYPLKPGQYSKAEKKEGKAYAKALNRNDQKISETVLKVNKQQNKVNRTSKKLNKNIQKLVNKQSKMKEPPESNTKYWKKENNKVLNTAEKLAKEKKKLSDLISEIDSGQKKTNSLLKEAAQKGYQFDQKAIERIANKGQTIVMYELFGIIGNLATAKTRPGVQYKFNKVKAN